MNTISSPIVFTVITVTYNAAQTLPCTLRSVEEQDYPHVEHLIVDGASKDDTLNQIVRYRLQNAVHEIRCISEPDKGLYDAMNKGLRLAQGTYLVFLNAGDAFHAPDTLSRMAGQLSRYGAETLPAVLYGDTDLVDEEGYYLGPRHLSVPEHLNWRSFQRGMLVCHQSFYVRTDLARQVPYDLRYRYSADVDWCIRVMRLAARKGLPLHHTHMVLTNYLSEGLTSRNHMKSLRERFRVMCAHYGLCSTVFSHVWFVLRSLMRKIKSRIS